MEIRNLDEMVYILVQGIQIEDNQGVEDILLGDNHFLVEYRLGNQVLMDDKLVVVHMMEVVDYNLVVLDIQVLVDDTLVVEVHMMEVGIVDIGAVVDIEVVDNLVYTECHQMKEIQVGIQGYGDDDDKILQEKRQAF